MESCEFGLWTMRSIHWRRRYYSILVINPSLTVLEWPFATLCGIVRASELLFVEMVVAGMTLTKAAIINLDWFVLWCGTRDPTWANSPVIPAELTVVISVLAVPTALWVVQMICWSPSTKALPSALTIQILITRTSFMPFGRFVGGSGLYLVSLLMERTLPLCLVIKRSISLTEKY